MVGSRDAERSDRDIDVHVGCRVRARRESLGISRSELAEQLDLSTEQLRRYESGVATIVASRLHALGDALDVAVSHFFEGVRRRASATVSTGDDAGRSASPSARELSRMIDAFRSIGDAEVRQRILALALSLSDGSAPIEGPAQTAD